MHEPLKAVALTAAVAGVLLAAPIGSIVAVRAAAPVLLDDSAVVTDTEHEVIIRPGDTGCPDENANESHPRAVDHPDGTTATVTWGTAGQDTIVIRPGQRDRSARRLPASSDEAAPRTADDRPMTFVDVTRTERSVPQRMTAAQRPQAGAERRGRPTPWARSPDDRDYLTRMTAP
ncbi:hypothetical protein [Streptomyces sp. NPDC088254]|uniref:hypothetical protein n=1 Tax=Streptomyces sp. NPDC088254 TaxID=3365847 RepID=UPI00382F2A83